jgi:hypothetical protein
MGIVGCQGSSPCPDLGDTCPADQTRFSGPAASLACECSLTERMLGAGVDETVTDEIWAQQIENIGGAVACTDGDAWINRTAPSMGPAELIHHVQLPAGACCGEWVQKLKTTFGDHLNRAGPSPCGDWTLRYPWGTVYAH